MEVEVRRFQVAVMLCCAVSGCGEARLGPNPSPVAEPSLNSPEPASPDNAEQSISGSEADRVVDIVREGMDGLHPDFMECGAENSEEVGVGLVVLEFTIAEDGEVTDVSTVDEDGEVLASMAECISSVFQADSFEGIGLSIPVRKTLRFE
jgi:hypothetical protein